MGFGFLRRNLPFLLPLLLALAIRLAQFLFVVPLDAVDDSYHHWVISFWTVRVGLPQGRMWDLYGQEYYWGPTPHLIEGLLLTLLNTTSLLPYRLFNILLASLNAGIVGAVVRDRVGKDSAAILAGAVFALSPIGIWETFAVTEPLANFFFLLAVAHLNRSLYRAGLFFALASTSVAIYWLVSFALIVYYYLRERVRTENMVLLFGWLTVMIPYMLMLQFHTGIFYYPLYYQFLVGIGGAWITGTQVAPSIRALSILGLAVLGSFGLRSLFRKREFDLVIVAFGLFTATHLAIFAFSAAPGAVGFLGRFFLTDWAFLALLLGLGLGITTKRMAKMSRIFDGVVGSVASLGLTAVLVVLLLSGIFTTGAYATRTVYDFNSQDTIRQQESAVTDALKFYNGGTIIVNHPTFAYFLVQHGVAPRNILSSQYAPTGSREALLRWLRAENVRVFILTNNFRDEIILQEFPALRNLQSESPFVLVGFANQVPVFAFGP